MYAYPPLPILFAYHDYVGQPVGILYFSYGPNAQQLLYVFINHFVVFECKLAPFLLHLLEFWVDNKLVRDNAGVNAYRFFVALGKAMPFSR